MENEMQSDAAKPTPPMPENIRAKWGDAAKDGYQPVPHALFKFQEKLGLNSSELVTLLNILDFWWQAGRRPCPGVSTLAKRMNVDARTVQRHLKKLETKGYAVRERGNESRWSYNLDGLVNRLNALVTESGAEKPNRRLRRDGSGSIEVETRTRSLGVEEQEPAV